MKEVIERVEAALEFLPNRPVVIPYDIVHGIVLDELPLSPHIDAKERIETLENLFLMTYDPAINGWRNILDCGIECIVEWSVLVRESHDDWWIRIGELQLLDLMAEIPDGYEFKYYPGPDHWVED